MVLDTSSLADTTQSDHFLAAATAPGKKAVKLSVRGTPSLPFSVAAFGTFLWFHDSISRRKSPSINLA